MEYNLNADLIQIGIFVFRVQTTSVMRLNEDTLLAVFNTTCWAVFAVSDRLIVLIAGACFPILENSHGLVTIDLNQLILELLTRQEPGQPGNAYQPQASDSNF